MGPKLTREGERERRTDGRGRHCSQGGSEEGREARLCILALLPPRCRLLNPPLSLFLVAMTLAIAANLLTSKDSPALASAAAALAFVSMLKLRLAFPVQSYHAISRWSEAAGVQTRMNVNSVTEIFHRSSSGSERWKVAKCSELAKMNCFSIVRC